MSRQLLALVLLGTTGCAGIRHYERALPKRVEVAKETGDPTLELGANRLRDGSVEVWVAHRRPVSVSRTVVYQTSEIRYEWEPIWEILEVPVGVFWILPAAMMMAFYGFTPDEPNLRTDHFWWMMSWIFGPINPFQSFFFPDVVRNPISDVEVFIDEPVITKFDMNTPAKGVAVQYSFTNSQGAQTPGGRAVTDVFGRVLLGNLPQDAAWLHAEAGEAKLEFPLRR